MNSLSDQSLSVGELADYLGGEVAGDPSRVIRAIKSLQSAGPDDLSFLSNIKYVRHLETTAAGCVIVSPAVGAGVHRADGLEPLTMIVAADPYYAFCQAMVKFFGFREHPALGISPLASIHPTARVGAGCNIHPYACIGENVVIGENTQVYPHVAIMKNARLGRDCILYANASIYDDCILGDRVIVHSCAVIGSDGYGFAPHGGEHHKIPQAGNVIVEDDVEIGANSVIERAVLESTLIGKGTKLGNGVVIGHNCQIGEHNLLVSQVGIAGSTTTGQYVTMAGQVGVSGHLNIGDQVTMAAQSGVMEDVPPRQTVGGSPAMEIRRARRVYLQLFQLPEMAKRLAAMEKELAELKGVKAI